MVLSRIWSAFVIIAILVASFRMIGGDDKIFSRMVVGKSSDKYDSVFYAGVVRRVWGFLPDMPIS
jgi:hypothetical protein